MTTRTSNPYSMLTTLERRTMVTHVISSNSRRRLRDIEEVLGDPLLWEAMVEADDMTYLFDDFVWGLSHLPRSRKHRRVLKCVEEAMWRSQRFISENPTGLFQCLWNTCWWHDCDATLQHYDHRDGEHIRGTETRALSAMLEAWRREKTTRTGGFLWLRSLRPPAEGIEFAQNAVFRWLNEPATCIAFSPNGRRIAVGWSVIPAMVTVLDFRSGRQVQSLFGGEASVSSVAFSSNGRRLVSGSSDGALYVWDTEEGTMDHHFKGHEGPIIGACFSQDGRLIVSGSKDGTACIWAPDTEKGHLLRCQHDTSVTSVAFSRSGEHIASGGRDGTVRVWRIDTGQPVHCFEGHNRPVLAVSFLKRDRRIASCGEDGTLQVWDTVEDRVVDRISVSLGGARLFMAAFSSDGRACVGWAPGEVVHVWEVDTGQVKGTVWYPGGAHQAAVSPRGRRVATAAMNGAVQVWDVGRRIYRRRLIGHKEDITFIAYSYDGERVLSHSRNDGRVWVWDAESGVPTSSLRGVEQMVVVRGARTIIGHLDDGTVRMWEPRSMRQIDCFPSPVGLERIMDSTRGPQLLVRKPGNRALWIADVKCRSEVCYLGSEESGASCVAFSLDGRWLAADVGYSGIRLWDAQTGRPEHDLNGHRDSVVCLAFSPDSRLIASGSKDEAVRVWDVRTGRELHRLTGHGDQVDAVAFSHDGRLIVSGSKAGRTLRMWDPRTGKRVKRFDGWGDVSATLAGPEEQPFRVLCRHNDTVVEDVMADKIVARWPHVFTEIAAHPTRPAWAGAVEHDVQIVMLEGAPCAPATT